MHRILIIDDDEVQSSTVKGHFEVYLESHGVANIEAITQTPFTDLEDYFKLIENREVVALVLDEKLNDQSFHGNAAVSYTGSDLVSEIRKREKDFPVFAVTALHKDSKLQKKFSEFDFIVKRSNFYIKSDDYIPIILRRAYGFLESNTAELAKFSELTQSVANGTADEAMKMELNALQIKLELPYTGFDDRATWLEEYEEHIKELEKIRDSLKKRNE